MPHGDERQPGAIIGHGKRPFANTYRCVCSVYIFACLYMNTRLHVHMDVSKGSNEHTEGEGVFSAPGDSLKAKENCPHV